MKIGVQKLKVWGLHQKSPVVSDEKIGVFDKKSEGLHNTFMGVSLERGSLIVLQW